MPQDYAKAEEHYTISAERGDIIASRGWASLDNLYETRMDGARDYDVARIWYQKAADVGNLAGVALAGPLPYASLGSREKSEPYGDVLHIRPAFGPCPSRSDGFGKHEGQSVWASIAPPGRRGASPCSRGR